MTSSASKKLLSDLIGPQASSWLFVASPWLLLALPGSSLALLVAPDQFEEPGGEGAGAAPPK